MMITENQAIQIAKIWLQEQRGVTLPIVGAFYRYANKENPLEQYDYWTIVFQCDVPKGFSPDQVDLYVNAVTGEVEDLGAI
jgi:hypothetical protein